MEAVSLDDSIFGGLDVRGTGCEGTPKHTLDHPSLPARNGSSQSPNFRGHLDLRHYVAGQLLRAESLRAQWLRALPLLAQWLLAQWLLAQWLLAQWLLAQWLRAQWLLAQWLLAQWLRAQWLLAQWLPALTEPARVRSSGRWRVVARRCPERRPSS